MLIVICSVNAKFNVVTHSSFLKEVAISSVFITVNSLNQISPSNRAMLVTMSKEILQFMISRKIIFIPVPYTPDFNIMNRWLFAYLK